VKTTARNPAHHMPAWTPALTFHVPGIPHAKQRPRMTRSGKTFTPPATRAYERSVALHARAVARARQLAPKGTPVRVDILAQYPRPKRLAGAPDGLLPKFVQQHGDLDNHVKAVLDGINKSGIWGDDCQVQCIRAESVYCATGHRPQSSITISLPTDPPHAILATSTTGAPR